MTRDGPTTQPEIKAVQPADLSKNMGAASKVTDGAKQRAISFKVSHVVVSILFLWLLIIHVLGILYFAKGFLLTRLILEERSQCNVLPDGSPSDTEGGCWHPKAFDRAVVIVIDALRYDFTVPSLGFEQKLPSKPYQDAFPLLHNVATKHPENAFLLPFIADPPTTTLQRLKGLTTGSLPTFIEAGKNFAGTAIEEDNLVTQLRDAGKTIVHLGDDTWQSLFPGHFDANLTHSYDSFAVWDLHTVDNGVIEHIMPLLQPSNTEKWDVIFAHFLGVDHAGHRYGPDHPAITGKLQQMDKQIGDIMNLIDDKTVLVVMGDHGMDTRGDHGGESDEELEAALWFYSKAPRFGRTHFSKRYPPKTAKERPVRQIDLVPTLSLLLGTPIPFNNLGSPIEEAFTSLGKVDWKRLASVNLLNFHQMQRYQSEYIKARELGLNEDQHRLYKRLIEVLGRSNPDQWEDIYHVCRQWEHETLEMYRRLWAKFNFSEMIHGIEVLAGGLLVLLIFARLTTGEVLDMIPAVMKFAGLGAGAGATIGSLLCLILPAYFTAISGMFYGLVMGSLLSSILSLCRSGQMVLDPLPRSVWGWMTLVFTISQAAGFAANSYTIHEDTILTLFLTSAGVVFFVSSLRQADSSDRILGVYHSILFTALTRVASFSRLCREEQMPGCRSTFYASSTSPTSAPVHLLLPYAIALLLPEIIKAFYKGTASYEGSAGLWIGFCFRMGLLLVAAYWTLDAADTAGWLSDTFSSDTLMTIRISVARCALAIALPVGIATTIWAKPCVNIFLKDPASSSTTSKPQITILGYANVHGTRYFLLLPIFILTTALLLPPMGQFALATLTWQILSLLELLDTNHLNSGNSSIGPVLLAMLGSYHFFKTGHQAVLSSIQWNAAYVAFRSVVYPWSPLLMLMNTFGAQILCAAAVPLTVLWKRPARRIKGLWGEVLKACATHILYYAVIQLATTAWAGHLRRHLMLYRVFMPRFLMGSVVLVIVDVVLIVVCLMGVRVSGASVGEVFGF